MIHRLPSVSKGNSESASNSCFVVYGPVLGKVVVQFGEAEMQCAN